MSKFDKLVSCRFSDGIKELTYEDALVWYSKHMLETDTIFSDRDHQSGYAKWMIEYWAEGDVMLCMSTGEVLPCC